MSGLLSFVFLLETAFLFEAAFVRTAHGQVCDPGMIMNTTGACTCIRNVSGVACVNDKPLLAACHCQYYDNLTSNTIIGSCAYTCFHNQQPGLTFFPLTENSMKQQCHKFNREGLFCGKCQEDYALPVYTYSLLCTHCKHTQILKYIAVAYLPLTCFLVAIIVFKSSILSPLMYTFVTISQAIGDSSQLKLILLGMQNSSGVELHVVKAARIILAFFGIWNLDFFRTLYPPFCLKRNITAVEISALDYGVAFYPLVVIMIMYFFAVLHSRGCRVVLLIAYPFTRFGQQIEIRNSLVHAFATFFVLSYQKLLRVSTDILIPAPVHVIHANGTVEYHMLKYLYYDPTTKILKGTHLIMACIAATTLLALAIPILILMFYQCSQQRIEYICPVRQDTFHTFIDVFQGDFKDGTNGTRDCRYFSSVYLLTRFAFVIAYVCTLDGYFFVIGIFIVASVALAMLLIQPYKKWKHNMVNVVLLVMLSLWYVALLGTNVATVYVYMSLAYAMACVIPLLLLLYAFSLLIYRFCYQRTFLQTACVKLIKGTIQWIRRKDQQALSNAPFGESRPLINRE